jgi:hypothetical protein
MGSFKACLFLVICVSIGVCYGESPREDISIGITFVMDGKLKRAPKFIELRTTTGDLIAQVEITNGKFQPPPIAFREPVMVVFQFQGRRMAFRSIYPIKFKSASWKVGIKRPPFDSDDHFFNGESKEPKEVWFVDFNDGTRQEALVYSKKKTTEGEGAERPNKDGQ